MEPLLELPRTRWHELQALYRTHWPEGAAAVCLLESYICCPGLELAFGFKMYCPDGDINKGMVAMTDKKDHLELLIHPLQNGKTAIENAILKTSLIDWNKAIHVPFANNETVAILERIKGSRGISVFYNESTKAVRHVLRRQSRQFENISCPPNTYVGPLKAEHISVVDNTWAHQSDSSHKVFETLIKYDLTYVLYSDQDKPLAWVTVNPEGWLSHLFCLEEHRNRGYAEFIAKVACNDLLGKERDVLAYTTTHNVKAQKLFSKLGFETEGYVYWVILTKIKGDKDN